MSVIGVILAFMAVCVLFSFGAVGGFCLAIYLHDRRSPRYPQLRVTEQVGEQERERDWQWPPKWVDPGAVVELRPNVGVELRDALAALKGDTE